MIDFIGNFLETSPKSPIHPNHHLHRIIGNETREVEMGDAAVEVEESGGVRGSAKKKSEDTVLAEERSKKTGREGYARDEERRKT